MRKALLFFVFLGVCLQTSLAQSCIPDTTLPDSVIVFPLPFREDVDSTGIMDTACVNTYFETVIHFQIPSEVTTQIGTFPIDSVELATEGAVNNAPAGFDYICNPPNCVFKKDTTGCIVLFGTPEAGAEGVYDLTVDVTIRSVIDLPLTLPDQVIVEGNYFLTVKEEGAANCTTVSARESLQDFIQLQNVPNPFGDYTEIRVSSQLSGAFTFEVFNVMGQRVHQRALRLHEGPNFIPFDSRKLANGMYVYTIRNREGYVSGRMLLSRGRE